jgi:hypothetical protein
MLARRRYWRCSFNPPETSAHPPAGFARGYISCGRGAKALFAPCPRLPTGRTCDWPHSSFKHYVTRGDLPPYWGGDVSNLAGGCGE